MDIRVRAHVRPLVFLLAYGALRSLACTEDAERPAPPAPSSPAAQPAATTTPQASGGVTSSPIKVGCEELGNLSANALTAKLIADPPQQSAWFTLSGRPDVTKIGVIGVGTASELIGPATLGSGADGNYSTCTHCLVVAVGCTTDCSQAAWFYPRKGTGAFTAVAAEGGQTFEGSFNDVELVQVSLDANNGYASTPIANGACVHISSLTFSAQTSGTTSSASSSSSSSTSSSSSSSTSSSTSGGVADAGSTVSDSGTSGGDDTPEGGLSSTSSTGGTTTSSSGNGGSTSTSSSGHGGGGGGGGGTELKNPSNAL